MLSGNVTITSKSLLAGIFILIIFVAGCAAIQETHGISPTDLSSLYFGMEQSEVEKIVGNPITEPETEDYGYSAVYRFNRGYLPPDEHKISRAVFLEFFNIWSIGASSLHTYNHQKALLDVEYDKDGRLINASESMEVDCSSLSCGAACIRHDCYVMQNNYLYPSTLPLSVSKHYHQQRSTPPLLPMPPQQ